MLNNPSFTPTEAKNYEAEWTVAARVY
jgi:hypothetical protein